MSENIPSIPPQLNNQSQSQNERMEQQSADQQAQEMINSSSDEQQRKLTSNPFTIITARTITKKEQHKCENKICASQQSKVSKVEVGPHHYLCDLCNLRFKEGHYCYYCYQIYFQYADGKDWIQCDKCLKWIHCDCEEKLGDCNIKLKMSKNTDLTYYCPRCKPPKQVMHHNKKQSVAPKEGREYKDPKDKNRFVKRIDTILNGYGFYWKLKPQQIQSDLEKLRKL